MLENVRRLALLLGPALVCLLVACDVAGGTPPGGDEGPTVPGYRLVADVPLPGGSGRWGYQVLDPRAGRLYLAHQGASEVVVVDTVQQRVVATVPGIESVHGLALAPTLGRLYGAANSRNEVDVIDLASNRVVARVHAGIGPDGLTYVSSLGRLFVTDGNGSGETVVDALTGRARSRFELGGGPGDSQFDPGSGRVL